MALSDKEQRLLEQLEAALAAEDPKLANTLRGTGHRTLHRRRAALAGVGFVLGVVALVAGMQIGWGLSIVGFVVMLAATIVALTSWKHVEGPGLPRPQSPRAPGGDGAFIDRIEDRWRRRTDDGI